MEIFEHSLNMLRTVPDLIAAIKHSNAAQEVILEYDNLEGQKASGKQHPQTKAWVRLSGRATRRKNQSYAD